MSDRRRTRTPRRVDPEERRLWTIEEIRALGATTDVVTAGEILGLSRNTAYTLARRGTFPIPVIKAGAKYRVPVTAILAALQTGISPPAAAIDAIRDPP
jgi:predicted DNA-binding transcriptional regulator AlpA